MAPLDYRYGFFLRPSPELCRRLADAHLILKQQYGFTAAAVFPPHATIFGHLATTAPCDDVATVLDAVVRETVPFAVTNRGMRTWGKGIAYDIDGLVDGSRNPALVDLFDRAFAAVEPIRTTVETDFLGGVPSAGSSRAHLTLAAQDLGMRPDLAPEVLQYLRALGFDKAGDFTAEVFTLYRFTSVDWSGRWWETMQWEIVRSWSLA